MGFFDFLKRKPSIPHEALTLSVHRQSFLECATAAEALPGFQFGRIAGVFGVAPALRTTDDFIYVGTEQLEGLRLTHDEAFATAGENAGKALSESRVLDGLMIWEGHGVESLVVLAPLVAASAPVKGAPVVMVPAEGLALMAGADDEIALERLLDLAEDAYAESDEFISLRPVTWAPGNPVAVEWLPPEGHPLRTRFRTAAAITRRHEAQGLHHVHASELAPLAHLAALDAHGGVLTAAWMRDADVVIPRVDRVLLLDTDDAALPRLDVDLATLIEVCAPAFEVLSLNEDEDVSLEDAQLLRLRGTLFPTPSERRFLLQRMAFRAQSPNAEAREVNADELLAEWDRREAVRAEAAFGRRGHVRLEMPDRRYAFATVAAFGKRMETRPVQEQARFQDSFLVNTMLHLIARAEEDESAAIEPEEVPDFPAGLRERGMSARPLLMSSNAVRAAREQQQKDGPEGVGMLLDQVMSTWEPSQLFPAVRPPGYEEGKHANELGMVMGAVGADPSKVMHAQSVSRPAAEGLRIDLVSDRGDRMMVLSSMMLTPELIDAAWRSALLNLEAASLAPLEEVDDGVYESPWGDDYDFARVLLLPRLIDACKVKGSPLVFAPTVGQVWITGSEDEAGLTTVLDAIDEHLGSGDATTPYQYRQMLFGWPWTVREGALVKATAPAAFAERIAALDAKLERRRDSSRKHVGDFARAVTSPSPAPAEGTA